MNPAQVNQFVSDYKELSKLALERAKFISKLDPEMYEINRNPDVLFFDGEIFHISSWFSYEQYMIYFPIEWLAIYVVAKRKT